MPMFTDTEAVRRSAWHRLSPDVAAYACMTLQELQHSSPTSLSRPRSKSMPSRSAWVCTSPNRQWPLSLLRVAARRIPDPARHPQPDLRSLSSGDAVTTSLEEALSRAVIEAARRHGRDGNGQDGLVGYLAHLRQTRPDLHVDLDNIVPLPRKQSS